MSRLTVKWIDPEIERTANLFGNLHRVCAIFCAICILLSSQLQGQVVIREGRGDPPRKLQGDWYLDTVTHHPWFHYYGAWQRWTFAGHAVKQIELCSNTILLRTDTDADYYSDVQGRRVNAYIVGGKCRQNAIYWGGKGMNGFIRDAQWVATAYSSNKPNGTAVSMDVPDTLGGKPCFCMSAAISIVGDIENYHAWGMIDLEGFWLIQPIFDRPFLFQDGFAAVIYYGQQRKINEKGEFVE